MECVFFSFFVIYLCVFIAVAHVPKLCLQPRRKLNVFAVTERPSKVCLRKV